MSINTNIVIPVETIAEFCQRHFIRKLSLFGSALREDFTTASDIDVLVEFESGHTPDFLRFVEMQTNLSEILQREVDLHTPQSLSRYFRQKVLQTARVIYERA